MFTSGLILLAGIQYVKPHKQDVIKKPEKDLSALCQQYDSVLSAISDKHAHVI